MTAPVERAPEPVSVIATCLNEAATIRDWWATLSAQTLQPAEIVIVDGGSGDGTVEFLRDIDPRVRVLVAPGANIPQGRNIAIAAATCPLIAVTDAGTSLERDWLERLIRPLTDDTGIDVSGGFFRPRGNSFVQRLIATVITPRLPEITPDTYLPSSRSLAFRREAWARVDGYPDWLRWGEDVVFDLKLREAGARFAFVPDAIVDWYPAETVRQFIRQYRLYARGDGQWGLWPVRHALRYAFYSFMLALLVGARRRSWLWTLVLPVANAYLRRFYWRVRDEQPFDRRREMLAAYLLTAPIVAAGDAAKMVGYVQGRIDRHRAGGRDGLAARTAAPSVAEVRVPLPR
jgi:GT2 family glycosyltransferase